MASLWHILYRWVTWPLQWVRKRSRNAPTGQELPDLANWSLAPETVAHGLLGALYATLVALYTEQGHLLFELGQTAEQQFQLSQHLAANLYVSGIPPYPSEVVQRYLTEREIGECVWGILCHERAGKLYGQLYASVCERMAYQSRSLQEQQAQEERERRRKKEGQNGQHRIRIRRGGKYRPIHQREILVPTRTTDTVTPQL